MAVVGGWVQGFILYDFVQHQICPQDIINCVFLPVTMCVKPMKLKSNVSTCVPPLSSGDKAHLLPTEKLVWRPWEALQFNGFKDSGVMKRGHRGQGPEL